MNYSILYTSEIQTPIYSVCNTCIQGSTHDNLSGGNTLAKIIVIMLRQV